MKFSIVNIEREAHLDVDARTLAASGSGAFIAAVCAPGATITTAPGVATLWVPLHGTSTLHFGDCFNQLRRGMIAASDAEQRYEMNVSPRSGLIAIMAAPKSWFTLGLRAHLACGEKSLSMLFPALHVRAQVSTLHVLRLCRRLRANGVGDVGGTAALLDSIVSELQAGFEPLVARCPGSTRTRRIAVLVRLQRVRNYIACSVRGDLDIAHLAAMANYSPSHFIRAFRAVFEMTPYAFVSRCRIANAQRLLRTSELGVCDIAEATGFEHRTSFCRAIKRHLGISASQLRGRWGSAESVV